MARYVLKLARDANAYAVFSTVVDGFVSGVLTRDEMFRQLRREDSSPDELIEARLVRADLSGTSSKGGVYGFDDGSILFLEGGAANEFVPRDELLAYARQEQ
jgi:hypothetical protein